MLSLDVRCVVHCEWLAKENTSRCGGRSGEAVVVGSFTDIQRVLLEYWFVREFWQKAYDLWFKKNPPGQCVYMMSPLPDQIVHLLVIVQDGTAILSVVLQIVSQESWALQLLFFFPVELSRQTACSEMQRQSPVSWTLFGLTETRVVIQQILTQVQAWWIKRVERVHGTDFSSHSVFLHLQLLHWRQSWLRPRGKLWPPLVKRVDPHPWTDEGSYVMGYLPFVCVTAREVHLCLFIALICRDTEGEQKRYAVTSKAEVVHSPVGSCCSAAAAVQLRGIME